jgi:hypothetical protein
MPECRLGGRLARSDAARDPLVNLVGEPADGQRANRHRPGKSPALHQSVNAAGRQSCPGHDCGTPKDLDRRRVGIASLHEPPLTLGGSYIDQRRVKHNVRRCKGGAYPLPHHDQKCPNFWSTRASVDQ